MLSGLPAAGCTRYYFRFEDAAGAVVTYPESGSLGIGPNGSCSTWTSERPPNVCCTGLIFADGFESGDTSLWN